MKYLLFSVVLLLSSCTIYYPYTVNSYTSTNNATPNRLTDIPLSPHKNAVDVFFGDEKPKEKYIKAFLLEEIAYSEISYGSLVNRLKKQAQQKGVDALIILSRDRNIAETEYTFTITNSVSALGIKYLKNLEFGENVPKQAVLSVFDEEQAVYNPLENFLLSSNMQVQYFNESNLYLQNFHYHSLDYMLDEINENWHVHFKEGTQQIYKRQYRTLNKNITFTFTYNSKGQVIHVLRHYYLQDNPVDIEIEFEYEDGKLSKSKVYQKTRVGEVVLSEDGSKLKRIHKRTEVFEYHSNGKPLRRTIFQIRDGKPKPFMKLSYEYYTEKEYEQLVKKAQGSTL